MKRTADTPGPAADDDTTAGAPKNGAVHHARAENTAAPPSRHMEVICALES